MPLNNPTPQTIYSKPTMCLYCHLIVELTTENLDVPDVSAFHAGIRSQVQGLRVPARRNSISFVKDRQ